MEVFTIEAHEEVAVVRRALMKSHEADEFKPCACLDENTGRENIRGKAPLHLKEEGSKGEQGRVERKEAWRHRVSVLHPFLWWEVVCVACSSHAL